MATVASADEAGSGDGADLARVADILGGSRVLKTRIRSQLEAHELLLRGLPGAALTHLVEHLAVLRDPAVLEKTVGISLRTFQRRKIHPGQRLSQEQSGRTWKFAEILARATAVLGSRAEAESWLQRPAIGLDRRRPVDLMATAAGVDILETYLERLKYGVYT